MDGYHDVEEDAPGKAVLLDAEEHEGNGDFYQGHRPCPSGLPAKVEQSDGCHRGRCDKDVVAAEAEGDGCEDEGVSDECAELGEDCQLLECMQDLEADLLALTKLQGRRVRDSKSDGYVDTFGNCRQVSR